jgi:hypothetical protein
MLVHRDIPIYPTHQEKTRVKTGAMAAAKAEKAAKKAEEEAREEPRTRVECVRSTGVWQSIHVLSPQAYAVGEERIKWEQVRTHTTAYENLF